MILPANRPIEITDGHGKLLVSISRGLGNDIIVSFEGEIPLVTHTEIWQGAKAPYPVITAEYEEK